MGMRLFGETDGDKKGRGGDGPECFVVSASSVFGI